MNGKIKLMATKPPTRTTVAACSACSSARPYSSFCLTDFPTSSWPWKKNHGHEKGFIMGLSKKYTALPNFWGYEKFWIMIIHYPLCLSKYSKRPKIAMFFGGSNPFSFTHTPPQMKNSLHRETSRTSSRFRARRRSVKKSWSMTFLGSTVANLPYITMDYTMICPICWVIW